MTSIHDLVEEAQRRFNKVDPDLLTDLYADDAVLVVPGRRYEGKQQIRRCWALQMGAFPNGTVEILRGTGTEDTFFCEFTARATHTGDLELPDGTTVPPTGKTATVSGMELFRVSDGKIIENSIYYDLLDLMSQLGLMPG